MGNLHKLPAVVWRRFPLSTRPRPPKLCGEGVLQFNERVQINLKRQLNPFFSGFGQIFATPPGFLAMQIAVPREPNQLHPQMQGKKKKGTRESKREKGATTSH